MTKSSEQPTSMLQSISDVERTISSEIDCQEDTSMSIAETTELSQTLKPQKKSLPHKYHHYQPPNPPQPVPFLNTPLYQPPLSQLD